MLRRLGEFMKRRREDVYSEFLVQHGGKEYVPVSSSDSAADATTGATTGSATRDAEVKGEEGWGEMVIDSVVPQIAPMHLRAGDSVLDLGCGTCRAMERFRELGMRTHGVTLGTSDAAWCRDVKGFTVTEAPVEVVGSLFRAGSFDMIFARHSMEHTVAPMFVLDELKTLLSANGTLYLEVPMPGTDSKHEDNVNHYSVLGADMWKALLGKVGYEVVWSDMILLHKSPDRQHLPSDDQYWYALAKKRGWAGSQAGSRAGGTGGVR